MNRGSKDGFGALARAIGRFNEAPIHESGKCHFQPSRRIAMQSLQ